MEREEFLRLADECLAKAARWCEAFDPDELDFATTDGVVTFEFADRTRYVLNRQAATNQMWFAAGARAWHYNWNAARSQWLDDRDQHELFARVTEVVAKKLGRPVHADLEEGVTAILSRLSESDARSLAATGLHKGDRVKIQSGAFAGFEATVDQLIPDKGTITVLVTSFNPPVRIELERGEVEAL